MYQTKFLLYCILIQFVFTFFIFGICQAQLISIKSIPIAEGNQFLVFPSQKLGMGGVSIAVEDSLGDLFTNPAKGAKLKRMWLFSAPTFYTISDNYGSASTLPVGIYSQSNQWFATFSAAIQQMELSWQEGITPFSSQQLLSEQSSSNTYLYGMVGKKLADKNLSIAASFFWSDLGSVEGVDLLYPRSEKIDQFGNIMDFRLGLYGELAQNRTFEALVIHHRFDMTHNVKYRVWDTEQEGITTRTEKNLDQTNTLGLHLGYKQPINKNGWKIGGIFTTNYKWHPKIPNYELMNIPRDPGDSWAFDFGVGFSKRDENTLFGIDVIYEPIWSETWAEAATPTPTVTDDIIPIGGKTVENHFRFSNSIFRIGLRRQNEQIGFQIGLQVRSIRYRLEQWNFVEKFKRNQAEHWTEWTPSWGLTLNMENFQLHYLGSMTAGTGEPGVSSSPIFRTESMAAVDASYIVAPSGPLTLEEAVVFTHQIFVSVPVRK